MHFNRPGIAVSDRFLMHERTHSKAYLAVFYSQNSDVIHLLPLLPSLPI